MRIIFFDSDCGLCSWAVRCALKRDHKGLFLFSPLNGETAQKELAAWRAAHPDVDSIVLLDSDSSTKYTYYSQAIFRIAWLLGFPWSCVGLLSFLPAWARAPLDWVYRVIASLRKQVCPLQPNTDFASCPERLLP